MAKKKIYTSESGEDGKDDKDSRRTLNKTIKKSSHKRDR